MASQGKGRLGRVWQVKVKGGRVGNGKSRHGVENKIGHSIHSVVCSRWILR
jgi:hypothetical protein